MKGEVRTYSLFKRQIPTSIPSTIRIQMVLTLILSSYPVLKQSRSDTNNVLNSNQIY
jgi:hypothetical protein